MTTLAEMLFKALRIKWPSWFFMFIYLFLAKGNPNMIAKSKATFLWLEESLSSNPWKM